MCGTARTPAQGGPRGGCWSAGVGGERGAWGVRGQCHGAAGLGRVWQPLFRCPGSTKRMNAGGRERGWRDRTCAPSAASATVDAPAAVKVARRTARLSGMSSTCPGEGQERCFTADSVLRRRRLAAATGRRAVGVHGWGGRRPEKGRRRRHMRGWAAGGRGLACATA